MWVLVYGNSSIENIMTEDEAAKQEKEGINALIPWNSVTLNPHVYSAVNPSE